MNQEEKDKNAPKCVCGEKSVFVFFNTFNYYYCRACKIEVPEDNHYINAEWKKNHYFY